MASVYEPRRSRARVGEPSQQVRDERGERRAEGAKDRRHTDEGRVLVVLEGVLLLA
jgi:hypothetical protein